MGLEREFSEWGIVSKKQSRFMNVYAKPVQAHPSVRTKHVAQNGLKIALQSALAAALCLGFPTGLFFWLITLQRLAPSPGLDRFVTFLSNYFVPPILLGRVGAFAWGFLLSKISGYRQWWWPALASLTGFWLGDFALYHGLLPEWVLALSPRGLAPPVQFGLVFAMTVLSVTISIGLLLGFTLRSWRASLMLAVSTGSAATLAAVATLIILDGFGIRVGSGNAAMPKATAVATMAAALAGGIVLGVLFSRYVRAGSLQNDRIAD